MQEHDEKTTIMERRQALADELVRSEDIVLAFLDQLPGDKRWLAIARTHIEEGFMAARRAVLDGKRA